MKPLLLDLPTEVVLTHLKDKFEKLTDLIPGLLFNQLVKSYFIDNGILKQQFNKHIKICVQCALNSWTLKD